MLQQRSGHAFGLGLAGPDDVPVGLVNHTRRASRQFGEQQVSPLAHIHDTLAQMLARG
jgi:hypothetical protein